MVKIKLNIVLIGMPGSGKTTIGRALSSRLSMQLYDTDELIEKSLGIGMDEIFKIGEDYFRKAETLAIKKVSGLEDVIISTGGGVIKNKENMDILKERGVIFFINRDVGKILKDADMSKRPLLSDNPMGIYDLYRERIPAYRMYCDYEVQNNDIKKTTEDIIKIFENL